MLFEFFSLLFESPKCVGFARPASVFFRLGVPQFVLGFVAGFLFSDLEGRLPSVRLSWTGLEMIEEEHLIPSVLSHLFELNVVEYIVYGFFHSGRLL